MTENLKKNVFSAFIFLFSCLTTFFFLEILEIWDEKLFFSTQEKKTNFLSFFDFENSFLLNSKKQISEKIEKDKKMGEKNIIKKKIKVKNEIEVLNFDFFEKLDEEQKFLDFQKALELFPFDANEMILEENLFILGDLSFRIENSRIQACERKKKIEKIKKNNSEKIYFSDFENPIEFFKNGEKRFFEPPWKKFCDWLENSKIFEINDLKDNFYGISEKTIKSENLKKIEKLRPGSVISIGHEVFSKKRKKRTPFASYSNFQNFLQNENKNLIFDHAKNKISFLILESDFDMGFEKLKEFSEFHKFPFFFNFFLGHGKTGKNKSNNYRTHYFPLGVPNSYDIQKAIIFGNFYAQKYNFLHRNYLICSFSIATNMKERLFICNLCKNNWKTFCTARCDPKNLSEKEGKSRRLKEFIFKKRRKNQENVNLNPKKRILNSIQKIQGECFQCLEEEDRKRIIKTSFFEISQHKFLVAPPGFGPQTTRVWEGIYSGCVVIIFKSAENKKNYQNLPVKMVRREDFENLNREKLDEWWEEHQKKLEEGSYEMEKLTVSYWREVVRKTAESR